MFERSLSTRPAQLSYPKRATRTGNPGSASSCNGASLLPPFIQHHNRTDTHTPCTCLLPRPPLLLFPALLQPSGPLAPLACRSFLSVLASLFIRNTWDTWSALEGTGEGSWAVVLSTSKFLNLLPTLWNGLRYRCLFATSREGDIDIESGQREAGKRSDWVETNTRFRLYGRGGEEQGSEWEGFR